MSNRNYYGKIILFGEYTVLEGYSALAMPHPELFGCWDVQEEEDPRLIELSKYLMAHQEKTDWLKKEDILEFECEAEAGLKFESNIPSGYGAGSSGALIAAWYNRYVAEKGDLSIDALQARLALLESHYHGTSSGLDPLVSYLNTTILVQDRITQACTDEQLEFPKAFELIDTGKPRSSAALVAKFQEKKKDKQFLEEVLPKLGAANDAAIQSYRQSDAAGLLSRIKEISQIQFEHFEEMVPDEYKERWQSGWQKGEYYKLCGAGGGGYLLKWNEKK